MKMPRIHLDQWLSYTIAGMIGLCTFASVMAIDQDLREKQTWHEFSQRHDCRATSERKSEMLITATVRATPTGVLLTPLPTAITVAQEYRCKDGQIYWR